MAHWVGTFMMTNKFKNNALKKAKKKKKKDIAEGPPGTINNDMEEEPLESMVQDVQVIPDAPEEPETENAQPQMAHWAGTMMMTNRFLEKTRKKKNGPK